MDADDDDEGLVQFASFTCAGRRRLLNSNVAKRIVLGTLYNAMRKFGVKCIGFVIMPNHVHAILYLPSKKVRRKFMRYWKRKSSINIRKAIEAGRIHYPLKYIKGKRIWIHRKYSFTIKTRKKLDEKLEYMHMNPVKAGFVEKMTDWQWSSARYYELDKDVGLPISWIDLD
jgi:putative transposase